MMGTLPNEILLAPAAQAALLLEERGGPSEEERGNPHKRGELDEDLRGFVPLVPADHALDWPR